MAGLTIHPRADWGFPGWAKDSAGRPRVPASVRDADRTEFFTHYEGGTPTRNTGAQAMRDIDAGHRANGWSGVGYNHVVMQDGSVWEGRGWTLVGAHCPDHNRSGWGVQVHIGGDQQPTAAALRSCRALYDEACTRAGHQLAKRGHRDGYATECPGTALYAWVQAGMPTPPTPKESDMKPQYVRTATGTEGYLSVTPSGVHALTGPEWRVLQDDPDATVQTLSVADWQALAKLADPKPQLADVEVLAAALAAHLPTGLDPAALATAIVDDLAARVLAAHLAQ